ncbi:MAG: hypothetical protein HQL46_04415 [Gammaproteobacteria bacterium]|nr:hypothetical protein [Gammaproteobacteria bacterium]
MQPIQIILDDAPAHINVPDSLQHHKVEVTFKVLDDNKKDTPLHSEEYINSICGILQSPKSMSLKQMDDAIKQRGGNLRARSFKRT